MSDDFSGSLKLADAQDRIGFVKKVYSILFAQLLLTGICIAITITSRDICVWMAENWWLTIMAIVFVLIAEISLICCRSVARTVPANYIVLLLFTLCEAYLVSFICMLNSYQEVCDDYG